MKSHFQIITHVSAASILTFSMLAEDSATPKTTQRDYSRDQIPHSQRMNRLNEATKASDLMGMTVKNYQDETLGKVEDLAVDVESGRIVQVILSVGGFIGIGDTLTAVPPGALHHDAAKKVLHLNASKEKLEAAPKFEMAKWVEASDSNHLSAVYGHYGEAPAYKFVRPAGGALDGQRNPDGSWDQQLDLIPASRLMHVQKASKLIGTPVRNLQDEGLGKVENLLVDMPSGRVVAVVISSGGFLGLGDELSAVPPSTFRFTSDRSALQLDATKERLTSSPHFKSNHWPDFAQPGYTEGIYRAYRVRPYFTTNITTDADNTARNVRDRESGTLTPLDQGNSKSDVATTAKIRKDILAEKGISVNGRNVKIITINGRVTLRGPVKTVAERDLIAGIASRVAHTGNVDNQLEVTVKEN